MAHRHLEGPHTTRGGENDNRVERDRVNPDLVRVLPKQDKKILNFYIKSSCEINYFKLTGIVKIQSNVRRYLILENL